MAYANSADPDVFGAVWSGVTLCAISLNSLRNNCIKAQIQPNRNVFVKHYAPNFMLVHTKKCQSWEGA